MNRVKKLFESRLYRTIAAAVIILAACVTAIFVTRSYAVAEVNGRAISVTTFKLNYVAARSYYDTLKADATKNNVTTGDVTDKELRVSILYQLIENAIIDQGFQKEVGSEADGLVAGRIKEYADDPALVTAAKDLYGFSSTDFTREILIPQAKMDILRGRLFLKNEDFKVWLADAKKSASVKIFSNDYAWDGTVVSAK